MIMISSPPPEPPSPFVAKRGKLPEPLLQALHSGSQLEDRKLDALASFTRKVVQERGWVKDSDVQSFLAAGYIKANIFDVILGVAQKTVINYVNHINDIE